MASTPRPPTMSTAPASAGTVDNRPSNEAADTGQGSSPARATPGLPLHPRPPRPRRNPRLIAASIALISVGALVFAWLLLAATRSEDVVAMARNLSRGATITRDALTVTQVRADPVIRTVAGADLEQIVGKRAAMDLPAGGVLNPDQITTENLPPEGFSVVGLNLPPAAAPASQLRVGDRVRVVTTTPQGSAQAGEPPTVPATIVDVAPAKDDTTMVVNVQVARAYAPLLAAQAAAGRVALVLDSLRDSGANTAPGPNFPNSGTGQTSPTPTPSLSPTGTPGAPSTPGR